MRSLEVGGQSRGIGNSAADIGSRQAALLQTQQNATDAARIAAQQLTMHEAELKAALAQALTSLQKLAQQHAIDINKGTAKLISSRPSSQSQSSSCIRSCRIWRVAALQLQSMLQSGPMHLSPCSCPRQRKLWLAMLRSLNS